MIIDFILILVLLALLWFLDEILTLKDTYKYGTLSERNPVMKYFLRKGRGWLIGFKIFSFVIFAVLELMIYTMHVFMFYLIAISVIAIYLIIDISNFIYFEKTK